MEINLPNLNATVTSVLNDWASGKTIAEIIDRNGITHEQAFAITQAEKCGLEPNQITPKLEKLTPEMDSFQIIEVMGLSEKLGITNPNETRRKNFYTAQWLQQTVDGVANPNYDPKQAAKNTDW